ncbi:MAG: glycosyltransferase family 39 protein [Deltaproteobacteria bacterium]|nr:glycosyltransferase family 39 protein [Deltaproteobacteria bacterium]
MPAPHVERRVVIAIVITLIGIGVVFRFMHLGTIPGINGDEGWWGVQSTRWMHGLSYEAKTTSGNPIDMAFLVPLGLLHGLAGPSFFVLRLFPAIANVVALGVGFSLARKLYGSPTAWIYTCALAVAPTAIAHSRFCQDPSQSILWTSITMFLALLGLKDRRHWWAYLIAALLAFGMGFWTHPTNVFVAPFLVLPIVPIVRRWIPESRRGRIVFAASALAALLVIVVIVLFVIWPALKSRAGSSVLLDKPWLSAAAERVASPAQWFEHVRNYGRLFTGVTVYRYMSMPDLTVWGYGASALLVMAATGAGVWRLIRLERMSLDVGLVFGWGAAWLLFFLFAGPESIRPHVERWGLVLIPPALLLLARGMVGWLAYRRLATLAVATVLALALLGTFYASYFHEFQTSGGRSHRTFKTASTEPKQQALERILDERKGSEPVLIITQEWWQYWPIRYLAQPDAAITVEMKVPDSVPASGRMYFVDFVGTEELARARAWIAERGLRGRESAIQSAGGRDLVTITEVVR